MKKIHEIIDAAYALFEGKSYHDALEKIKEAESVFVEEKVELEKKEYNEVVSSIENFKGFNYLALNELEKAKRCFEKSLKYNPNSSQGSAGLGEIFYLCNMDYEAKVMFEWAIDYNPLNQFAVSGLAKANKNLLLPDNHNSLNLEVRNEGTNNFYALVSEAYQKFNAGSYREALDKLAAAENSYSGSDIIENKFNTASILNFKGFNHLFLKEFEKAKDFFEAALKTNPDSSQACAGLGEIFFIIGDMEKSKTMYEWGVHNNNGNAFAANGLSKVNKELGYSETHNTLMN